jgi:dTDP-4-dehydrorhamnose 3,5-epimerase
MKLLDTALPEVKRIQLNLLQDARGFFVERHHSEKFAALGIPQHFEQLNHSCSLPGVIRGLHFQHTPMQGKLVGVTRGAVLDVAVDVRPHSAHFGRHVAIELSEEKAELLWIPPGFAHGFCVLGNAPADVVYQLTTLYAPAGEQGIRLDDPDIAIAWPTPLAQAILSARDRTQPSLRELKPQLAEWFRA